MKIDCSEVLGARNLDLKCPSNLKETASAPCHYLFLWGSAAHLWQSLASSCIILVCDPSHLTFPSCTCRHKFFFLQGHQSYSNMTSSSVSSVIITETCLFLNEVTCQGTQLTLSIFLNCFPPSVFETEFSLNLALISWARLPCQWVPAILMSLSLPSLFLPHFWGHKYTLPTMLLCVY